LEKGKKTFALHRGGVFILSTTTPKKKKKEKERKRCSLGNAERKKKKTAALIIRGEKKREKNCRTAQTLAGLVDEKEGKGVKKKSENEGKRGGRQELWRDQSPL